MTGPIALAVARYCARLEVATDLHHQWSANEIRAESVAWLFVGRLNVDMSSRQNGGARCFGLSSTRAATFPQR